MPGRARNVAQLAIDEVVITDPELEAALEDRLAARETLAEYRADVKAADEKANTAVEKLELPEGGAVRVGRFRISRQYVKARTVSFETEAKSRVAISVIGEDE